MRALVKTKFGIPADNHIFFDDFFGKDFFGFKPYYPVRSNPAVNVKEDEKGFTLEVAAPGLKKEDFRVELENGVLSIAAESQSEKTESGEKSNYTRREFSYQSFKRSFTVDEDNIDGEHISAKYEDGVLQIELPKKVKAEEVKRSKLITIA